MVLGLVMLAGCQEAYDDAPAAAPASPPGLHAYLYHENMVIDGPSLYWLDAVPPTQQATKALWCPLADDSAEILRVNNQSVQTMTREEVAAYFSGGHGWPVHLRVRSKVNGTEETDCYGKP